MKAFCMNKLGQAKNETLLISFLSMKKKAIDALN